MTLCLSTGLTRTTGDGTRLVESDDKEENTSKQKCSILLEKFQETDGGTEVETISASGSLDMLEGLLDRITKILRSPARRYRNKAEQTYHGIRMM